MGRFKWDKKYLYWGVTAVLVIICSITFFTMLQRWSGVKEFLSQMTKILTPVIWGFALAYLLNPMVRFFGKSVFTPLFKRAVKKTALVRGLSRALSIVFSLIVATVVISTLLWMVLPEMYYSIESIALGMPDFVRSGIDWVGTLLAGSPELESYIISLIGGAAESITSWIASIVLPRMSEVITGLSSGLISLVKGIMNIFVGIIFSCYILYNKETFSANAKKVLYSIFGENSVGNILIAIKFTDNAFSSFISGKLLDSLIIGILCYFGCWILKMPYAVLVSVIVGVTNIIPFFGPFIGAIPSAIIILMVDPLRSLIFLLFIVVLQQIDGNVIGPKILGSATGLNGFWVMFSIIVGGGMFGFAGMVCGVPVFTVIYAGLNSLVNSRLKKRGLPHDITFYMTGENNERSRGTAPPGSGDTPEPPKESDTSAEDG